jgi:predicted O-methyltransferase YrrM
MNVLELAEHIGVTGFLHCEEAWKLVELAANKDVLEIGSYRGLSAWLMAISAKSVSCVDTFHAATNGQRQTGEFTTLDAFEKATARFRNIRSYIGHSQQIQIPNDFDVVFIDGCHQYNEVRDDIHRWWQKIRPGGLLVNHDYHHPDWPGVTQALDEIFGPAPEGTTLVTLRWIVKPSA